MLFLQFLFSEGCPHYKFLAENGLEFFLLEFTLTSWKNKPELKRKTSVPSKPISVFDSFKICYHRDKHDRRSESPSKGRRGHRSRERDRRRSPSLPRSYKDNASPALRGARSRSRSHSRERFPHHRNRNIGVFGLRYKQSTITEVFKL